MMFLVDIRITCQLLDLYVLHTAHLHHTEDIERRHVSDGMVNYNTCTKIFSALYVIFVVNSLFLVSN